MPDDLTRLADDLEDLARRLIDQQLLDRVGLAAERRIRERTRRGIGVDGRRFEPYSEGHARRRRKRGLPTDVVNLSFDLYDGMLSQRVFDYEADPGEGVVTLGFTRPDKARLARYHHEGMGHNPRRPFFDLSDDDLDAIGRLVEQAVDDLLRTQDLPTE